MSYIIAIRSCDLERTYAFCTSNYKLIISYRKFNFEINKLIFLQLILSIKILLVKYFFFNMPSIHCI